MTDEYQVVQSYCMVRKGNNFFRVEEIVKKVNEQEETIQNQKGYILLLEEKLEEYGIRLEPKDFD